MTEETVTNCNALKPVRCGCGGEATTDYIIGEPSEGVGWFVYCKSCEIQLPPEYNTEAEAIEAWNEAMGADQFRVERTAKVIQHDASVTDTDGYKYHRSEYLCGACKKKVIGGDDYCSHCGCRLDWDEDIPMEYFESGGK